MLCILVETNWGIFFGVNMRLLLILSGGLIGTLLRCFLYFFFQERFLEENFFYATIIINLIGCFLAGFFYSLSHHSLFSTNTKNFMIAGICGSLTTFSQFIVDTLQLWQIGLIQKACLNLLFSAIFGLILFYAARKITSSFLTSQHRKKM